MVDWDDLRVFLAVARAGSFSAAARVLGVAQPTVGRRIAGLERSLGARLFVAAATGQSLSRTGQMMLARAEQMEAAALAAERVATGRDAGLRGRVVITASEWLVGGVLGPLLGPLVGEHPGLELELVADARHLNLARRDADIAVRPSRFEQAEVVQRQVGVLAFGLYASDGYLARRGAPDFAAQCEGHELIAMSESLTKIPDVEWLPQIAARARIAVRTNGREPMVAMAAAGLGLACLPRFLGDRAPNLRLLPTPVPGPRRQLWLGVHRDVRSVPRVRASAAFLAEALGRLAWVLGPA
jgi:DNA-binding transcriptional LysR family regulator